MLKSTITYQKLSKITAALLLLALLIPTGLHAKQLVDFCMIDMKDHPTEMATNHSCCESETKEKEKQPSQHQHHDCDWAIICACSIGQSQLGDEDWIPTTKNLEITLTQLGDIPPYFTSGEYISADQQIRIGEYAPPLWLLYDTFLM